MKTKLISMQWRGCASVDPRFSAAMLPWTIADIYSREQYTNVSQMKGIRCFEKYLIFSLDASCANIETIPIKFCS